MSPSILRARTAHALRRARATYGDEHPATWAAYGRAIAVWGRNRIAALAPSFDAVSRSAAIAIANTAGLRLRASGFDNRRMRARRA